MVQLELTGQCVRGAIDNHIELEFHGHIVQRRAFDWVIRVGKIAQLENLAQRCGASATNICRVVNQPITGIGALTAPTNAVHVAVSIVVETVGRRNRGSIIQYITDKTGL